MKTILLFLALVSSALAQTYALKTPDNSGLFLDKKGNPAFVELGKDFPAGKVSQFWPVDKTVPAGQRQIGWTLSGGKCVPLTEPIPAKSAEEVAAETAMAAKLAEAETDRDDVRKLKAILPAFKDGTATREQRDEAIRLLLRDYLRRLNE